MVTPDDDAPDREIDAIHLPGKSYQPVLVAFGLTLAVVGVATSGWVLATGLVVGAGALVSWVRDTVGHIRSPGPPGLLRWRLRVAWWSYGPGGGSLRRDARRVLRVPWAVRAAQWTQQSRSGPAARLLRWAPYVALVGAVFLPMPGWLVWRQFADGSDTDFLGTLWQVVGAVLALSLAMIGFVFEAFMSANNRAIGGSLREFARVTRLQMTLNVGFAALVCDGLVLLHVGHGAPGGWAAMWATLLSGAALALSLPFAFHQTLKALEFDYLVGIRARQIEKLVDAAMYEQLIGQAGQVALGSGGPGAEVVGWPRSGDASIVARRAGRVVDIKVRRLRSVASAMAARRRDSPPVPADAAPGAGEVPVSVPAIGVIAKLEDHVGDDAGSFSVPHDWDLLVQRSLRRMIRVKPSPSKAAASDLLVHELERLHEAAVSAIRAVRRSDWEQIRDVYERVLFKMPEAAKRLEVRFEGVVAAPGLFGVGPLARFARMLYEELRVAAESEDRELASAVTYFPAHVAHRAAPRGDVALVEAMLSMYPSLYYTAATADVPRTRIVRSSFTRLFEWAESHALTTPESRAHPAELQLKYAAIAFDDLNELVKLAIDIEDIETTERVVVRWRDEPLDRDHYGIGEPDEVLDPVWKLQDVLFVGLAMWAAHRLEAASDATRQRDLGRIVGLLASQFVRPEQLADALAVALDDDERWSTWFLSEHEADARVMSIPTREELIRATVALALCNDFIRGEATAFPPEVLLDHHERISEGLDAMEADRSRWAQILQTQPSEYAIDFEPVPVAAGIGSEEDGASSRVDLLLSRVTAMRAQVRDARVRAEEVRLEVLRDAPLDATALDAFREAVLSGHREHRVLGAFLEHVGAARAEDPPSASPTDPVFRRLMRKEPFVGDPHFIGADRAGKQWARSLVRSVEVTRVWTALADADIMDPADDMDATLKAAIRELGKRGFTPNLLLVPVSWRLSQLLTGSLGPTRLSAHALQFLPTEHIGAFDGVVEGTRIPVLHSASVPRDQILLLDARSALALVERPSEQRSGARLTLRAFNTRTARAYIRAHPAVRHGDLNVEASARLLRENVLVEIAMRWRIETRDARAALFAAVPEELRHPG